jgi:hypothetical protein
MTTIPFPAGIPSTTTQLLLHSGHGDAVIPLHLPFGRYSFLALCTNHAPLEIVNVVTFVSCSPQGAGNTITTTLKTEELHIRTTTSWTLYVGKPN